MAEATTETSKTTNQPDDTSATPDDGAVTDENASAEAAETSTDDSTEGDASAIPLQDVLPLLGDETEPTFWDDLRDVLPSWMDELIGIALLIFGILSMLALLYPSGAIAAVTWANILRGLFGDGGILVAGGIFALGIVVWLPKVGIHITFSPGRILAIEAIFLCALALLHIFPAEEELRALARAGDGGGVIGWGLTAAPYWLLGRNATIVLYGIIGVLSLAVVIGIQRRQIIHNLEHNGERLLIYSETLSGAIERVTVPDATPRTPDELAELVMASDGVPVMRIVPDLSNLPPSLRKRLLSGDEDEAIDLKNHPLFQAKGDELKLDINLIGELTGEDDDDGVPYVKRPDGRIKRYFSVERMKEEKKVDGRRSNQLPAVDVLKEENMSLPEDDEINHKVVLIENTLLEFDIDIDVVSVEVGPTVTRYAVKPYRHNPDGTTERTRVGKITSYHNDLSLALSAKRLRIETPVAGENYVGIEVPNEKPSLVTLRSVFESRTFYDMAKKNDSPLNVPLGRDVTGRPVAINLAKIPHLLIAGTTGSGKSVCIAALASALLLDNKPDTVKLIMLDPKMVELSRFNGLPHLMGPVETDTERIIGVLKWCTREMDRRYKLLEEHAVRNIDGYNTKVGKRSKDYMPYIVILIDEIGDLMMSQPDETERAVTRLAQMARAVGMHLVIATQRPSVDVITGLIKANFPGRIGFSVASGVDSRVILDTSGAEHLMGNGDMLYLAPDAGAPIRVQGCFVSDEEVRDIVDHWKRWYNEQIDDGNLRRTRVGPWHRGLTRRQFLAETDDMLEDAIEYVVKHQEASASLLQRELNLGYPRAARILDMLAELGVVGEPVGGGRARKVLIPKGEDPFKRLIDKRIEEQRRKQTNEYRLRDD